jgi:hypothetical protein
MHPDEPLPEKRWRFLFSWPTLLMLGLLVYELTSEAALGVAILCLKFGLEDFLTARWLRRQDSNRARGRTCFWLFLSWGLWKSALVGVLMMVAAAVVLRINRGNAPAPPAQFGPLDLHLVVCLLTAVMGFLACAFTGAIALARGLLHGQKLWLNSALHAARRDNLWPLPAECMGNDNKAGWIAAAALFFGVFITGCACFALIVNLPFGPQQPAPAGWRAILFPILSVAALTAVAVTILLGLDFLRKHVLAKSPHEFWPPEGDLTDCAAPVTDYEL